MNAKINRELFTQKTFDSGALGVMTSVIHQFARNGNYQATVLKNGKAVGAFTFAVEETDAAMQLTVDLAAVAGLKRANTNDDCLCVEEKTQRVVSSKGYVVFYASTGTGYSVRVGQVGARAAEFDSAQLNTGDLFTLTLLEPTTYSVANTAGKGKAEIVVAFKPADAKRLRDLEPVYVEVKSDAFKPAAIKLISTQGLIFRIGEQARIVVEKTGKPPEIKRESVYRWRKLQAKK